MKNNQRKKSRVNDESFDKEGAQNRNYYLASKDAQEVVRCISKFTLVDLAGSERLSEGEKTMDRIEEAKYINKSLAALGNVILHLKNQ